MATTERLVVVREGVHVLSVGRIAAGVRGAIRRRSADTDGLLREVPLRNAPCIADTRMALLVRAGDFDAMVDAIYRRVPSAERDQAATHGYYGSNDLPVSRINPRGAAAFDQLILRKKNSV